MSLAVTKTTGRRHLACDVPGCQTRFHMHRPGESLDELKLRASVNGWKRIRRLVMCPGHAEAAVGVSPVMVRRGPRRAS